MEHLSLTNGEVHLWHVFLDDLPDGEKLPDGYAALLTEEEREKSGRFLFDRDRLRYIVTRVLVRETLSRYVRAAPVDWRFCESANGRPRIAEPETHAGTMDFNLSHTDDLVIMAVRRGSGIGIDVENMERRVDVDSVSGCFMSFEQAGLSGLPPELRRRRFFELWTLKESYVKACGRGLSVPLDAFGFDLAQPGNIHPVFSGLNHPNDGRTWRFIEFSPSTQHTASLCVNGGGVMLRAFRCVPLRKAASVPLWLRAFSGQSVPSGVETAVAWSGFSDNKNYHLHYRSNIH